MNRDELATALTEFIDDDVLQVAALSGDWGVGKTYFWRKYSRSMTIDESFNGQSYASLFGADSIDEIRRRISTGMLLSKDRKAIVARYTDQASKLLVPRSLPGQAVGFVDRVLQQGFWSTLVGEASYWFVRDAVVCLDDLERLGGNVDPRLVLGVVDELRERGCKVILLLNRDRLYPDDSTIREYWEKVVDVDLHLSPDVEANIKIAFDGRIFAEEFEEPVTKVLSSVGCRNIRIHRRTVGLLEAITGELMGRSVPLKIAVAEHAAMLCWALLDPDQSLSEGVVGSERYGQMWVAILSHGDARKNLSAEEEEWAKVIEKTGFTPLEFDKFLISYIKTGWLDRESLGTALDRVDAGAEAQQKEQQLYEAFRAYRDDFTLNRGQYAELITHALRDGLAQLTVFDFDTGLQILEQHGENIRELVAEYVATRGEHLQAVAEADGRDREPQTAALQEEVARRKAEYLSRRYTIDGVASDLTAKDGWSRGQIEFLAAQPSEAYLGWMRGRPPNLDRKIRAIQEIVGGQDETDTRAREALEQALRILAGESRFNAERIERVYGVTVAAAENDGPGERPD